MTSPALPGLGSGSMLGDPGASLRNSLLGKLPGLTPRAFGAPPTDIGP